MTTERIIGGIEGLLVGDALGVPYEFKQPDALPSLAEIEYQPPAWFSRSHPSVLPGTWSDDGAQALCLLESLLRMRRFDVDDFASNLVRWYTQGLFAVAGVVFDVGIQTADALSAITRGIPVLRAARRDAQANGNGALMRVLPLALWHRGADDELVLDARLSSRPTHGHVRSELCCALYCLWIRRLFLQEDADAWTDAVSTLRDISKHDSDAHAELSQLLTELQRAPTGSGYVVDTLRGAVQLQHHSTYEHIVKQAVALGADTDTTAAVAGGVAGVRGGVSSIPERWRTALHGREILDPLIGRLLHEIQG